MACWAAVENLLKSELLWKGTQARIVNELDGVRFKYKKASYVIEARNKFFSRIPLKFAINNFPYKLELSGRFWLKARFFPLLLIVILVGDNIETRNYIVENIKGVGYKEASHFLRNI